MNFNYEKHAGILFSQQGNTTKPEHKQLMSDPFWQEFDSCLDSFLPATLHAIPEYTVLTKYITKLYKNKAQSLSDWSIAKTATVVAVRTKNSKASAHQG